MQADVLTEDPGTLISRWRERDLHTQYVNEYFIPYRMTPDRMTQVREQLEPLLATPVNRDFTPIAYYFDVVLWSAQFKPAYASWFRIAAKMPWLIVFGGVAILILFVAGLVRFAPARDKRARSTAALCTAATGCTLMVLQISLLLAFQSIYGYVYQELAMLIGLFMAGIAFGSWLSIRRVRTGARSLPGDLQERSFFLPSPLPRFCSSSARSRATRES